jgi:hypothetical protein
MNFADISVKEPQSMVTTVVRLAERRAGGHAKVESERDETILVRSKDHVPFKGSVRVPNSTRTGPRLSLFAAHGSSGLAMKGF